VLYGYLLSEGSVVGDKETSWVLVCGLVAEGPEVAPQLKGHLKGAVNNGASIEEVRAVREMAVRVVRECGGVVEDGSLPSL
jgi:alkylhydroperoxidase/carboxymuconolactone decarboxylase family protein YurZ